MSLSTERLASVSAVSAVSAICCHLAATYFGMIYPASPGHRSSLYGEAGEIILLIGFLYLVFAATALFAGLTARERFKTDTVGKNYKIMAWSGIVIGGIYISIAVMSIAFSILIVLAGLWKQYH